MNHNQVSINQSHSKQFADDQRVIDIALEQECSSVTKVDELPEPLKYLKDLLPGILFWHHSPDGTKVPQFRPDNPKGGPKYIFPRDSGSVLSLNASASLDKSIVAIVEGTKQMIFATAYAPDDVLVVGIQGCWGWSSEGQGLASLDAIVKGKEVVVIFDADLSSNPDVYNAGASLNATLSVIGAANVTFAPIPGAKTVGLDDFLSRRPVENRADAFAEILGKAIPFSKVKKPAKRKVSTDSKDATFDFVSTELGEICSVEFEGVDDDGSVPREQEGRPVAGVVDERNVRRVDTLLYAAVTVDSIVTNVDDLTVGAESSISRHLKLQIGSTESEDKAEYIILNVPDAELGNVRRWLARAGIAGANVELGRNGIGITGGLRIAEAIRADTKTRDFKERISRPHSGWFWHDGEAVWSDTSGSHGATRKREDIVAKLEGALASLEIPGYHENYQQAHLFKALDELFAVEEYLYDSTPWVAGISALFWSLAGGDPNAVLYILGGEGSGKSSITGLVSSFLSSQWGTELNPMASADGSSAYLRDLTKQPHNMLLVVDDVRGRTSGRSQDTQADGLENLIRPGYSGGGAGSSKKVRTPEGEWVQEKPKQNRFFLCIVGEILPEAERQSSIERLLVVEVDKFTSLKPAGGDTPTGESGHEHFMRLSRERAFMPVTAGFLTFIAQLINEYGGIEVWRENLSTARTQSTLEDVATRVTEASARVQNVAGTFIAGATIFLEWVEETGYFAREQDGVENPNQRDEIENRWYDQLISATLRHSVVNLYSGGTAEIVIAAVRDAVVSGGYALLASALPNQTIVGVDTTVTINDEKVECVGLLTGIVAKICGTTDDKVRQSLRDMVVPGGDGKLTRLVSYDGKKARCLVIRKSDYEA